jgi:DHA1 family inner membrane transport protein
VLGLLKPIADNLGISIAAAGQLMTVYSIAYAVGSPFLVVFSGRLIRRNVVLLGLALMLAGVVASAVAPNTVVLYLTRIIVAFGAALYTPTAALVALTISPPDQRMRGLALVLSGLTVAQIVGIPIGTYIGGEFGWRWGMLVAAPTAAIAIVMVVRLVPRDIPFHPPTFATFGQALRDWRLGLVISVMAVMGSGQFMVTTYIAPLIAEKTGAGSDVISIMFIIFGIAAMSGTIIGGRMGDRLGPARTLVLVLSMTTITALLFPLIGTSVVVAGLVTALWAFSTFATMPVQQARVALTASPASSSVALSLNATAIYIATAVGASAGGAVIAFSGTASVPWAALPILLGAIVLVWFSERVLRRSRVR